MTTPALGLFDLPLVQDALNFALGKLADWQLVPERVAVAQSEVVRLAGEARATADVGKLSQLTVLKQSLDGIGQEYQDAAPLVAEAINAARSAQAGGSLSGAQITDAAKLATVMTANLAVLSQDEKALVGMGARLTPGPSGGLYIPTWAKWGAIGLGVWWLLKGRR